MEKLNEQENNKKKEGTESKFFSDKVSAFLTELVYTKPYTPPTRIYSDVVLSTFQVDHWMQIFYGDPGLGKIKTVFRLLNYNSDPESQKRTYYFKEGCDYKIIMSDILCTIESLFSGKEDVNDLLSTTFIIKGLNFTENYTNNEYLLFFSGLEKVREKYPFLNIALVLDTNDFLNFNKFQNITNKFSITNLNPILREKHNLLENLKISEYCYREYYPGVYDTNATIGTDHLIHIIEEVILNFGLWNNNILLNSEKILDKVLMLNAGYANSGKENVDQLSELIYKSVEDLIGKERLENEEVEYTIISKNISKILKNEIVGQDNIIDKIAQDFEIAEAGLTPKEQPLYSCLVVGDSGIGKTLFAKTLSQGVFGKNNLLRLDCGEFKSVEMTTTKLFGSAPGYVGYENGGVLTNFVEKNKFGVILVDEIEKADNLVQDLFLRMLDTGTFTDTKTGETISCEDFIFIFTSNANTNIHKQTGFVLENISIVEQLNGTFKPEFLYRFENIFLFNKLTKDNLFAIGQKCIEKSLYTAYEQGIDVSISKKEKDSLINNILKDPQVLNGRQISKLVTREINKLIVKNIKKKAI